MKYFLILSLFGLASCAHLRDTTICRDFREGYTTAQIAMEAAGFKGTTAEFSEYCTQLENGSMI